MRPASLFFVVTMGTSFFVQAAPTPDQQELIAGCGTMAQAVFEFAQARDKGLSKPDAFTAVTGGKVAYAASSQVAETENWAFDHPDEQAMTVAAHFHGRCVLDAWELLTPISDKQLAAAALACQQDHAGKPVQIQHCIDNKTTTIVADAAMPTPEATAVVAPPPATRASKVAMAAAPAGAAIASVPAPPPEATEVAVVPPPTAPSAQVAVLDVPAVAAIASVPAPPPEATELAAVPPPATQAPEVAMVGASAGAPITPVPAPPPEATDLAAVPPSTMQAPAVAMLTPSAAAAIAAVSPPVEATDLAAEAPAATQVPEVAMASMPAGAEIAAVPAPPPEVTNVADVPPPVAQAPEVAMVTASAGAPIAQVSVPPPVAPPAPAPVVPVSVAAVPSPVSQPAVAQTAVSVPAVATSAAASSSAPQLAVASALPVSLSGIGKLSIGMTMADAAKAMGRRGDDDTDAQGNPARSFMISDGHAYIELLTEPGKPDVVYGIEYHGGADAKVPPILGVNLGDDASAVLSRVGEPSSRSPAPLDRTLWAYEGRNYSFEISSGGDLITVRIVGYDGLSTPSSEPSDAATSPVSR
jgi:hypothetical protein